MSDSRQRAKQRRREIRAVSRQQSIREEAEDRVEIAVWNRDPLKHYVRREGWERIVSAFIRKLKACGITRPWKYLTFPGPDALDIGLLYQKGLLEVTPDGRLSVAICDRKFADKVALRLAKFGGVLASSSQELHNALNDPSNALVGEFPFDVVNLDFCNSLILPNRNNLLALDQVFSLQRGQGFLLLLTARPDRNQENEHREILINNLQNELGFREAYRRRYATGDPSACLDDYTTFTQIVISKIVARYGRMFGYRVLEHFVARYRRSNRYEYDMVSHSFELDPIGTRKNIKKYEPRLTKSPQRDRVEHILEEELSSTVRQEAEREYESFVDVLPGRDVLNINEYLENNQMLRDNLAREADTLEPWLNNYEI